MDSLFDGCYHFTIKSGSVAIRHAVKPSVFKGFSGGWIKSAYSHSLKFINSDLWRDLRIRIFKENRRHNLWFPQSVPFFSIKIVSRRYSKIIVDFSSEFKVVLYLFWNSLKSVVNFNYICSLPKSDNNLGIMMPAWYPPFSPRPWNSFSESNDFPLLSPNNQLSSETLTN